MNISWTVNSLGLPEARWVREGDSGMAAWAPRPEAEAPAEAVAPTVWEGQTERMAGWIEYGVLALTLVGLALTCRG